MRTAWWMAAAAALLAPVAGAQQPGDGCLQQCSPQDPDVNDPPLRTEGPVNVILYGHTMGILHRGALNTLPPSAAEPDVNQGFLVPTLVVDSGDPSTSMHFKNNVFSFRSCPGLVGPRGDGRWEEGCHSGLLGGDLLLPQGQATVYLYLSFGERAEGADTTAPSIVPLIGVRGRMLQGIHEAPGDPVILAEGDTGPGVGARVANVGGEDVYEFRLPLDLKTSAIPSGARDGVGYGPGFLLEVEPYEVDAGNAEFMQHDWRLRSGPRFPNRLILPLLNPLEIRGNSFAYVNGSYYYRASFGTPLGSYDLDAESLRLTIEGPTTVPESAFQLVLVKQDTGHSGTYRPVNASWRIDGPFLREHPGTYTFRASATNLQGTFLAQDAVVYEIAELEPVVVPGLGAMAVVASLTLAIHGWRPRPR